jgi:hypothetical protein
VLAEDHDQVDIAVDLIVSASYRAEEEREGDIRLGPKSTPQRGKQRPMSTKIAGLSWCEDQRPGRAALAPERSLTGRTAQRALIDAQIIGQDRQLTHESIVGAGVSDPRQSLHSPGEHPCGGDFV